MQTSFLDFTWDIMQTCHFELFFPDFWINSKISWLLKIFFLTCGKPGNYNSKNNCFKINKQHQNVFQLNFDALLKNTTDSYIFLPSTIVNIGWRHIL